MTTLLPTYFQHQAVSAEDLNQLFVYEAAQWREHNRHEHGCGVVCGLAVNWLEVGKTVSITPGYALSPQGDEILVSDPLTLVVDCAGPTDVDCGDLQAFELPKNAQPSSTPLIPFDPVYVALRYTPQPDCRIPVTPARCAGQDECLPTRLQPGFEVACRTIKPQHCTPRLGFEGASIITLVNRLGLLPTGQPLSDVYDCPEVTNEDWLILATVSYRYDEHKKQVAYLTYADRTYLPSTQYLLDLLRVLGAQALKKQAVRQAITQIGNAVGALPVNRGRVFNGLVIAGRGLQGAIAVRLEAPGLPALAVEIAPGSVTDQTLRINLNIPLDTPIQEADVVITMDTGMEIHSRAQTPPLWVNFYDNLVEDVPAIRALPEPKRGLVVDTLQAAGLVTAQQMVLASEFLITTILRNQSLLLLAFQPLAALQLARQILQSASRWLAEGAPG